MTNQDGKSEKSWHWWLELAGEVVVREEEELKSREVGEVRNGTWETVLLEDENSELSQNGERLEQALEIEVFKDKSRDLVVEARDAYPGTWVGGGVPSCKFVCFIYTGFECQERFQIWVFRSLGEKEMEDEKKKNER